MDNINIKSPMAEEPKTCTQNKPLIPVLKVTDEAELPSQSSNLVENLLKEDLKITAENESVSPAAEAKKVNPSVEEEIVKAVEKEVVKPVEKEAIKSAAQKEIVEPVEKESTKSTAQKEIKPIEKEGMKSAAQKEIVEPVEKESTKSAAQKEIKPIEKESMKSAVQKEVKPVEREIVKTTVQKDIVKPTVEKVAVKPAVQNKVLKDEMVKKDKQPKIKNTHTEAQKEKGKNNTVTTNKPTTAKERRAELKRFARKMFYRYIQEGVPPKKAKQLAFSYGLRKLKSLRSPRNNTKGGQTVKPKLPKIDSNLRLAVLPEDFPNVLLNNNQMNIIQEDLLKKVQAQNRKPIKPAFLGVSNSSGYLVLECANKETAKWLESLKGKFSPLKGIALKIIKEEFLFKTYTVVMSLPESKDESISSILGFINSQNRGVKTDNWIVVERVDSRQTTTIKFSIDYASVETLKKKMHGLYYKWGLIGFSLEATESMGEKRKNNAQARNSKRKRIDSTDFGSGRAEAPFTGPDEKQEFLNTYFGCLQQSNPFSNPWGEGPSRPSYENSSVNLNQAGPFQNYGLEPPSYVNFYGNFVNETQTNFLDQPGTFSNQRAEDFVQTSFEDDCENQSKYLKKFKSQNFNQVSVSRNIKSEASSPFRKLERRVSAHQRLGNSFSDRGSPSETPERKFKPRGFY